MAFENYSEIDRVLCCVFIAVRLFTLKWRT